MLKVLLVDDESIIRTGLRTIVNWRELGFEIVAEAEDGEQAIGLIEQHNPDVLLTDIRMAFMDGIELQRHVKQTGRWIYTVVVSGYDDFSYAQSMLNLGAFAYLLKPVNIEELEQVLGHIKEDIALKNDNESDLGSIQSIVVSEYDKEAIDALAMVVKKEKQPGELTGQALELYHLLDRSYLQYMCIAVSAEDGHADLQAAYQHLLDVLEGATVEHSAVLALDGGIACICAWHNDENMLNIIMRRYRALVREIAQSGSFVPGAQLLLSSSQSTKGLSHATEAISKAKSTLAAIREQQPGVECPEPEGKSYFDPTPIVETINFSQYDTIPKAVGQLREALLGMEDAQAGVEFAVVATMNHAIRFLNNLYRAEEKQQHLSANSFIKEIMKQPGLDEKLDMLQNSLDMLHAEICSHKKSQIVMQAMQYAKEHMADEELTVNAVAKELHLSFGYFSVLFKKEAGEPFTEYLTRIRMQQAKELFCNTDLKSYEVSYRVGYRNPTYFSTSFKKHFGVSPSAFKKTIENG